MNGLTLTPLLLAFGIACAALYARAERRPVMYDILQAVEAYHEKNGKQPYALYVDPITAANTNFDALERLGLPVKVSTACTIGNKYLVSEEEAKEIEEWEAKRRLVKDVRETLEKGREAQLDENTEASAT